MKQLLRQPFSRKQYLYGIPLLLLSSYMLALLFLTLQGRVEFSYDFVGGKSAPGEAPIPTVDAIGNTIWLMSLPVFAVLLASFEAYRRRGVNLYPMAIYIGIGAFLLIAFSAAADPAAYLLTLPALAGLLCFLALPGLRRWRVHLFIERRLRKWQKPIPYVLWAGLFAWMFVFSYHRFTSFAANSRDLGLFTQTVWLLSHGMAPHNTVMGLHAFGDHAEIIDFLAVPVMWAWESPGALLLLQSFTVSIGVVGMFKFARRKTRSAYAALVAAVLYPLMFGVQSAVMFDWNPETVPIGFVPWLFYFADSGKWKRAGAMLILIAISKENLLLFTTMFGLFTVFYYKRPKTGLAIFALSLAAFWAEIQFFFPQFRAGGFRHLRSKGAALLGPTFTEIGAKIVANPAAPVVYVLTGFKKAVHMIHLFAPLMFLALLFPYTIILTGSFLATRFLSTSFQAWIGGYFYGGIHDTLLLICVVMLVPHIARRARSVRLATAAFYVPTMAACSLVLFLVFSPLHEAALFHRTTALYPEPELQEIHRKAIRLVPDHAPVAAQDNIVPHLATRQKICQLEERIISRVDYIVVDKKGRLIPPVTVKSFDAFQKNVLASPEFEIIFHEKSVYVLARKDRQRSSEELAGRLAHAQDMGASESEILGLSPAAARVRAVRIGGSKFLPARNATGKQYDAVIDFAAPHTAAKEFAVIFAQGPSGHYEMTFGRMSSRLVRVAKGTRTELARTESVRVPRLLKRLTFRRLEDLIVVIADGAVVCRAIDSTFAEGRVLVPADPNTPRAEKVTIQRRRPLFFSDDFMVTPEEAAADRGWRKVTGRWEFKSIRPQGAPKDEAYHTRSANPFVYLGEPAAPTKFALTAAGEPWWSGHSFRAALKCLGKGAAGLAFCIEDEETFWLVRLECGSSFELPARLQLIRTAGGKPEVIAERLVPARHGQWYELAAEVHHGRVRLMFLDSLVLDVADRRISGGRIGLYAEGPSGAVFDDVEVRDLGRIRFDRAEDVDALGQATSGRWRIEKSGDGSADVMRPRAGPRHCEMLFGNREWEGGAVTAEARPGARGSFGLVAGAGGERSYRLELGPDGKGAVVAAAGGREEILREFSHRCRRGEWSEIGLNLAEKGVISAYVGGELVARVKIGGSPRGRVGLFAKNASDGALRGLVANRSPRLRSSRQIGNTLFLRDAHMSNWASERGQWIPNDGVDKARGRTGYVFVGEDVFWRKGDYYGRYVMHLPLTMKRRYHLKAPGPARRPISGSLAVHFGLKSGDLGSGHSVVARARKRGEYNIDLTHKGKVIASAAGVRAAPGSYDVRIFNSGRYVWATLGGRELFSHRKTTPDAGTRIAIVRKGEIDFGRLAVHAENLDDSSFERAPVKWRVMGNWHMSPRYECDPKWSWMGADSLRDHAAIWRRREFHGDVTVGVYASMKTRPGSLPYCPSDINLTISAEHESPGSGYTFIVGGWRNTRTALLRNGKVVAATAERYLPDTRDGLPEPELLHLRWFYVRARRKGPKIELYLDNKLALEYTDPQPLAGGKVGVWTQEQDISVARVQIYHSGSVAPLRAAAIPKAAGPEPPASLLPLTLTCEQRAGFFFDFETGTQGWCESAGSTAMPVQDEQAVGKNGGRASLRLVNAGRPGRFAAGIPAAVEDLLACPVLSFDYRIPPGVMINLYFDVPLKGRVSARTYFIALTGPEDSTQAVKFAGRFPDAKADGRWRTARIDIANAMRRFYPGAGGLPAANFRLALERPGTYAASGIGGNRLGASFNIDNFLLVSAAGGRAVVRWEAPAAPHDGYAFCLTSRPGSKPGGRPNLTTPYVIIGTNNPGVAYLHVRPVAKKGKPEWPVAHFPLCGVRPTVEIAGVSPADGSKWGGEPIRIQLRKPDAAALVLSTLVASADGIGAGLDNKALSMDWQNGILTLDASRLPVRLEDGKTVNLLLSLQARGGKPAVSKWRYVASAAHDKTPPGEVALDGRRKADDFETPDGLWIAGPDVAAGIDTATAAAGKGSLQVLSTRDGGRFSIRRPFSGLIGGQPVIEFDYKAGPLARTDLVLESPAAPFTVKFLDRSPKYRIGEISGIVADGKWRRAEVDIFDMLWRAEPLALAAELKRIGFGDYGWPSSRAGDSYHIDNFRVIPVVTSRRGLQLVARANDPLGIAGYAFKWSEKPEEEPPDGITATGDVIRAGTLPEGRRYLHIRAVDRAGNRGPVSHYAFIIDNTPPEIAAIEPKSGERISPHRFALTINDTYGPEPAKLELEIGGKTYTMKSASLESANRPAIVWNIMRAPEDIAVIADGAKIEFALTGVEDFAGNKAAPVKGHWTMDYKQDDQPPQRVEFGLLSAGVAFVKRFDGGLDGARRDEYATVTDEAAAGVPSRVLAIRWMEQFPGGALLEHPAFDLAKTGLIKLDVNLPETPAFLDLLLTGEGIKCKLGMGDLPAGEFKPVAGKPDRDGFIHLGSMNGARSAPGWHTQWADLGALVRKHLPGLKSYRIDSVRIGRYCQPYSPPRPVQIDNIMVYGYGRSELKLNLRSRDVTGIAGYATVIAADPAAKLPGKITQRPGVLSRTLAPGTRYIKALARDNNGNWSRVPGVLPYVVVTDPEKR